mgnify:FL=1
MTLKCSAEPKRRYVAQIAVFEAESEPLWLKNKMYPNGQGCGFQYPSAAFLYALRGASHGIASRDFVCHRSPNHSRKRLTLWGAAPNSPKGEMCMEKDMRIAVRVTAIEKEKIQAKARKCGLSTTEYVKQRALGYEPREVPPGALFACLERLGELADKASSPELDEEIYLALKQITAKFLLPGKG